MRQSLRPGKLLPESAQDFQSILLNGTQENRDQLLLQCADCGQPFSNSNMHTAAGWRESQISGICEDCFDDLFGDDPDPHGTANDPTYR
jgi:hypothetical protein